MYVCIYSMYVLCIKSIYMHVYAYAYMYVCVYVRVHVHMVYMCMKVRVRNGITSAGPVVRLPGSSLLSFRPQTQWQINLPIRSRFMKGLGEESRVFSVVLVGLWSACNK